MGLDVYVGPLTRYYSGEWKLAAQQAAEAQGLDVQVVRPRPERDGALAGRGPAEVRTALLRWRAAVVEASGGRLPELDWKDLPQDPYFTDKADWDGYWAVRLLAGRDEFPDIPAPREIQVPSRMADPSRLPLIRHVEREYGPRRRPGILGALLRRHTDPPPVRIRLYPHLHLPELWFPVDFDRPFGAPDPFGAPMNFGSLPRLLRELESLNARTLGGDQAEVRAALAGPPEDDRSVESVARFGLAVLLTAARYGIEHDVPMKLDY